MKRPLIGITSNFDPKDELGIVSGMGGAGQAWNFLADDYIRTVERAGGIPVILPLFTDMETLKETVRHMDGVLVSGGHDINPKEYGERIKACCGRIILERDWSDLNVAKYVMEETNKPMLGICRGIQVLNVADGGSLYQDLETEGGYQNHGILQYARNYASHTVKFENGSRLADIYESEKTAVNSFHHQGVKKPGKHFKIGARSEEGVTEAIEYDGERFVIGVQWHPEMMFDSEEQQKIFKAFVKACAQE